MRDKHGDNFYAYYSPGNKRYLKILDDGPEIEEEIMIYGKTGKKPNPDPDFGLSVTDDPYKDLACTIIQTAARDLFMFYLYPESRILQKKRGKTGEPEIYNLKECENFFLSEYFEAINPTKKSGRDFIEKIKSDAEKARNEFPKLLSKPLSKKMITKIYSLHDYGYGSERNVI